MTTEEAARHARMSTRTLQEHTRLGLVPHRRPPHTRRCLFLRHELDVWANGAELEVRELPGGGRVVSVVTS
jgi:hypothetical protein